MPNGDVALRKADSNEKPIVCISFSDESKQSMQDLKMGVARAMVEAAITTFQSLTDDVVVAEEEEPAVLH